MDAAESHLYQSARRVKTDDVFYKGLVVLQVKPSSAADKSKGEALDSSPAPSTTIEAGHLIVQAEASMLCNACDKPGHKKADCPTPEAKVQCRKCNETGHRARACPKSEVRKCHKCGSEDHIAKDCTQAKKPKAPKECLNCGSSQHLTLACTAKCSNCGSDPLAIGGHVFSECTAPVECADVSSFNAASTGENASKPESSTSEDVSKPESSTDGKNHALRLAAAEQSEEDDSPEPKGVYAVSDKPLLETRCETLISPFGSQVRIDFRATYPVPTRPTNMCKQSIAILNGDNLSCAPEVKMLDASSPELAALVTAETLADFKRYKVDHPSAVVAQVTFAFSPPDNSKRLGCALYSDATYGPYQTKMDEVRDCLFLSQSVDIHFLTIADDDSFVDAVAARMDETWDSMNSQASLNPLADWWYDDGRKRVVQVGMLLPPERRPNDQAPPMVVHPTIQHHETIHLYGAAGELEAIAPAGFVATIARFLLLEGMDTNFFYTIIEMRPDLKIPLDAEFSMRIGSADASSEGDWKGTAISGQVYGTQYDNHGFVQRPSDNGELDMRIKFPPETYVDSREFAPAEHNGREMTLELRQAMLNHPGVPVLVAVNQAKSNLEREANTVRIGASRPDIYRKEYKVLCNTNWLDLPVHNMFAEDAKKYDEDKVRWATDEAHAICPLSEDQKQLIGLLGHLRGGIGLIRGTGGSGKSHCLRWIAYYKYFLTCDQLRPARGGATALVSPLNRQCNDQAALMDDALMGWWRQKTEEGKSYRCPLVIRHQAVTTDKNLMLQRAKESRAKKHGVDRDPYGQEAEDAAIFNEVVDARRLREQKNNVFCGIKDSRVVNPSRIAEGLRVLEYAGVPDAQGELSPIAHPDKKHCALFRHLYNSMGDGLHMDGDAKEQLTREARRLAAELADLADVRCMTHHVFSESRQHRNGSPETMLHDEAGRAGERAELHALYLCRNYMAEAGEESTAAAEHVTYHIFAADPKQPAPLITAGDHDQQRPPFEAQRSISLFARWSLGGASAIELTWQHRYTPDIAAAVNAILPGEPVLTPPDLPNLDPGDKVLNFIRKLTGITSRFVMISIKGKAEQNSCTNSWYNVENVRFTVYSIRMALEGNDIPGNHICACNAYIAGCTAIQTGLYQLADHYDSLPVDDPQHRLGDQVRDILVTTMDGVQGLSRPLVFVDFTITESLRFLRDDARVILAITRARVGLVSVVDVTGLDVAHQPNPYVWHRSAIYRLVKYAKEKKLFRNYQRTLEKAAQFNDLCKDMCDEVGVDVDPSRGTEGRAANKPIPIQTDGELDDFLPERMPAPKKANHNDFGDDWFGGGFGGGSGGGSGGGFVPDNSQATNKGNDDAASTGGSDTRAPPPLADLADFPLLGGNGINDAAGFYDWLGTVTSLVDEDVAAGGNPEDYMNIVHIDPYFQRQSDDMQKELERLVLDTNLRLGTIVFAFPFFLTRHAAFEFLSACRLRSVTQQTFGSCAAALQDCDYNYDDAEKMVTTRAQDQEDPYVGTSDHDADDDDEAGGFDDGDDGGAVVDEFDVFSLSGGTGQGSWWGQGNGQGGNGQGGNGQGGNGQGGNGQGGNGQGGNGQGGWVQNSQW